MKDILFFFPSSFKDARSFRFLHTVSEFHKFHQYTYSGRANACASAYISMNTTSVGSQQPSV